MLYWTEDRLCYSHVWEDGEIAVAGVVEDYLYLSSVIGIDGAWCIQDNDLVFGCEAACRTDLDFMVGWDFDGDSCGDAETIVGMDDQLFWQICV